MAVDALRVSSDSHFFDSMLELIPAAFYLPVEVNESQWVSKFAKNKKDTAPKQQIKEASKKGKKAKFSADSSSKSTADVVAESADSKSKGDVDVEDDDQPSFPSKVVADKPAGSLDELKERLQAKILSLRGKRKAPDSTEGEEGAGNKRRKVESDKPKPKNEKKNIVLKDKIRLPAPPAAAPVHAEKAEEEGVDNMEFSSIKVSDAAKTKKAKGSLEQLLEKAKEQQARMKELQEKGEEGREMVQDAKWKTLMKRASGDKSERDDIKMLKKALKRKEAKKQKSAAAWALRTKEVEDAKMDRQKVRNDNLQKKREEKGSKKALRPGFEGKKTDFINGQSKGSPKLGPRH